VSANDLVGADLNVAQSLVGRHRAAGALRPSQHFRAGQIRNRLDVFEDINRTSPGEKP
jgi:hypothetical protein